MTYCYGPVPSRRLGRSLGVDLVPYKTCSYDCLYCQLGPTTHKTAQRHLSVPLDKVLAEIESALPTVPDAIALGGSGEPTLCGGIGELIRGIKDRTDTPVAVLTNGSLLWQEALQQELSQADILLPSLDAGDPQLFVTINRPWAELQFDRMLAGLIDTRRRFRGQFRLEMCLLAGLTDTDEAVARLADCAARIAPDRIDLNTVVRPPAEACAQPVTPQRLAEIAEALGPTAEVIAPPASVPPTASEAIHAGQLAVLGLLKRRPCCVSDIATGLSMHRNEVLKHLDALKASGKITPRKVGSQTFFQTPEPHTKRPQ